MLIGLGPVSTQRQALFLRDLREGEVPPCVLQGKGIATSEPIFFCFNMKSELFSVIMDIDISIGYAYYWEAIGKEFGYR